MLTSVVRFLLISECRDCVEVLGDVTFVAGVGRGVSPSVRRLTNHAWLEAVVILGPPVVEMEGAKQAARDSLKNLAQPCRSWIWIGVRNLGRVKLSQGIKPGSTGGVVALGLPRPSGRPCNRSSPLSSSTRFCCSTRATRPRRR